MHVDYHKKKGSKTTTVGRQDVALVQVEGAEFIDTFPELDDGRFSRDNSSQTFLGYPVSMHSAIPMVKSEKLTVPMQCFS